MYPSFFCLEEIVVLEPKDPIASMWDGHLGKPHSLYQPFIKRHTGAWVFGMYDAYKSLWGQWHTIHYKPFWGALQIIVQLYQGQIVRVDMLNPIKFELGKQWYFIMVVLTSGLLDIHHKVPQCWRCLLRHDCMDLTHKLFGIIQTKCHVI